MIIILNLYQYFAYIKQNNGTYDTGISIYTTNIISRYILIFLELFTYLLITFNFKLGIYKVLIQTLNLNNVAILLTTLMV